MNKQKSILIQKMELPTILKTIKIWEAIIPDSWKPIVLQHIIVSETL